MIKEEIQKYYNDFIKSVDMEREDRIWREQSKKFQDFWKEKILGSGELTEDVMDRIILMLDYKARGSAEFRQSGGLNIAGTGIRQGMWHRAFRSIQKERKLQELLNEIFKTSDEVKLIELVDKLKKENEGIRNGLTGSGTNILSAFLFINDPENYTRWVSLRHRKAIIESFEFGSTEYESWGAAAVRSHRQLIDGFREKFGIEGSPSTISVFLWTIPKIRAYWKLRLDQETVIDEPVDEYEGSGMVQVSSELGFALEKHLEDFLVANWESTELGKIYELIEEDGDMISQQYLTPIGNIDLLVKEKETGNYVVIELKKGQTSDQTVGQLTRYMAWVQEQKADGKKVKGIVIAGSQDERLKYALRIVPEATIFLYRVNFSLEKPEE